MEIRPAPHSPAPNLEKAKKSFVDFKDFKIFWREKNQGIPPSNLKKARNTVINTVQFTIHIFNCHLPQESRGLSAYARILLPLYFSLSSSLATVTKYLTLEKFYEK